MDRTRCNYSQCQAVFGPDLKASTCSACKKAVYCSSDCQRSDWKKNHKAICRKEQEAQQAQKTPSSPNIKQDLIHWVDSCFQFVQLSARSSLKLGRPDSLAKSHFIHLRLDYHTPPKSRWSQTGKTPVGDERDLFTFGMFNVHPDSLLDEPEMKAVETTMAEKRTILSEKKAGPDQTAFFVVFSASFADNPDMIATSVSSIFVSTHTDNRHSLTYAKRKLNPWWHELLIVTSTLPAPKNDKDIINETTLADCFDLAQSEDLKTCESLPFAPGLGWAAMRADVEQMHVDITNRLFRQ